MRISFKSLDISGLGVVYFQSKLYEEASLQFKRVVDANIIPFRDNWHFLFAVSTLFEGKLDQGIEMLSALYRKPVFEFSRECLSVCFDIEYSCLRESIYHALFDLAKKFMQIGYRGACRIAALKIEHPDESWGAY